MDLPSFHVKTPLIRNENWDEKAKMNLFFKLENLQPTGSFKIRGIGRLCALAKQAGKTGIVSSSGGNAGMAASYAARKLDLKATVVLPETTPEVTRQRLRKQGADVKVFGKNWNEADAFAHTLVTDQLEYVHPYDHPEIWNGHSSVVEEIRDQLRDDFGVHRVPDAIVLSVGGGGLFCGVTRGLENVNWKKETKIVTMETEGANCFHQSVKQSRLVTLPDITSVAKSLGARSPSEAAFDSIRHFDIVPFTVTDREAVDACLKFADDFRMLVEPACGATLSAITTGCLANIFDPDSNIVVIVCGGSSVDLELLHSWKKQFDL